MTSSMAVKKSRVETLEHSLAILQSYILTSGSQANVIISDKIINKETIASQIESFLQKSIEKHDDLTLDLDQTRTDSVPLNRPKLTYFYIVHKLLPLLQQIRDILQFVKLTKPNVGENNTVKEGNIGEEGEEELNISILDMRYLYTAIELVYLLYLQPHLQQHIHRHNRTMTTETTSSTSNKVQIPTSMVITSFVMSEWVSPVHHFLPSKEAILSTTQQSSLEKVELSHLLQTTALLEDICCNMLVFSNIFPRNSHRLLVSYFILMMLTASALVEEGQTTAKEVFEGSKERVESLLSISSANEEEKKVKNESKVSINPSEMVKSLRQLMNVKVQLISSSSSASISASPAIVVTNSTPDGPREGEVSLESSLTPVTAAVTTPTPDGPRETSPSLEMYSSVRSLASYYMTQILLHTQGLFYIFVGYLEDVINTPHFTTIQLQVIKNISMIPSFMSKEDYLLRFMFPQIKSLLYYYGIQHPNSEYFELFPTNPASLSSKKKKTKRITEQKKDLSGQNTQIVMLSNLSLLMARLSQLYPMEFQQYLLHEIAQPLLGLINGKTLSSTSMYMKDETSTEAKSDQHTAAPTVVRENTAIVTSKSTETFSSSTRTASIQQVGSSNIWKRPSTNTMLINQPKLQESFFLLHTILFYNPVFISIMTAYHQLDITQCLLNFLLFLSQQVVSIETDSMILVEEMKELTQEMLLKLFSTSFEAAVEQVMLFCQGDRMTSSKGKFILTKENGLEIHQKLQVLDIGKSDIRRKQDGSDSLLDAIKGRSATDTDKLPSLKMKGSDQDEANNAANLDNLDLKDLLLELSTQDGGENSLTNTYLQLLPRMEVLIQFLLEFEAPLYSPDGIDPNQQLLQNVGMGRFQSLPQSIAMNTKPTPSSIQSKPANAKKEWNLKGLASQFFVMICKQYFQMAEDSSESIGEEALVQKLAMPRESYGIMMSLLQSNIPLPMLLVDSLIILDFLLQVVKNAMMKFRLNSMQSTSKITSKGIEKKVEGTRMKIDIIGEDDEEEENEESTGEEVDNNQEEETVLLSLRLLQVVLQQLEQQRHEDNTSLLLSAEQKQELTILRDELQMLLYQHSYTATNKDEDNDEEEDEEDLQKVGNDVVMLILKLFISPTILPTNNASSTPTKITFLDEYHRIRATYLQPSKSLLSQKGSQITSYPAFIAYGLKSLQQLLTTSTAYPTKDGYYHEQEILSVIMPCLLFNDVFLYMTTIQCIRTWCTILSSDITSEVLQCLIRLFVDDVERYASIFTSKKTTRFDTFTMQNLLQTKTFYPMTEDFTLIKSSTRIQAILGEVLSQVLANKAITSKFSHVKEREEMLFGLLCICLQRGKYHPQYREEVKSSTVHYDIFTGKKKKALIAEVGDGVRVGVEELDKAEERKKVEEKEEKLKQLTKAEEEEETMLYEKLYLRQTSLSLLSTLLPLLPTSRIIHILQDMIDILEGILTFEQDFSAIQRSSRRSAIALTRMLIELHHELFFVILPLEEGLPYLTQLLRLLKKLHFGEIVEKDEIVKFQVLQSLTSLQTLTKDYFQIYSQEEMKALHDDLSFLRIV